MDTFQQALFALSELGNDSSTPKNVKAKIVIALKLLSDDTERSLKISKALSELEELTSDSNLKSDTRTQLFNIVSLLEYA